MFDNSLQHGYDNDDGVDDDFIVLALSMMSFLLLVCGSNRIVQKHTSFHPQFNFYFCTHYHFCESSNSSSSTFLSIYLQVKNMLDLKLTF